jgi:hypothetical protein
MRCLRIYTTPDCETSDGEVGHISPGGSMLVEGAHGKGHI